jgi:hypothetical protein
MASQMASQVQVVDNSVRRWSAVAQSFYCTGNKGKALATPLFGLLGAGIWRSATDWPLARTLPGKLNAPVTAASPGKPVVAHPFEAQRKLY